MGYMDLNSSDNERVRADSFGRRGYGTNKTSKTHFESPPKKPWTNHTEKTGERTLSVNNEAKKRIDAALGLLKLRNFTRK